MSRPLSYHAPESNIKYIIPSRAGVAVFLRRYQSIQIINTHGTQVVDTWAVSPNLSGYMSMCHTRAATLHLSPHPGDVMVDNRRRPIMQFVEDSSFHMAVELGSKAGVHDTLIAACDIHRYRQLGWPEDRYHDNCSDNYFNALKRDMEIDIVETLSRITPPDPLNLWMNIPVHLAPSVPPAAAAATSTSTTDPRTATEAESESQSETGTGTAPTDQPTKSSTTTLTSTTSTLTTSTESAIGCTHDPSARNISAGRPLTFESPICRPHDFVKLRALTDCIVVMSACPQDLIRINNMEPREAHYVIFDAEPEYNHRGQQQQQQQKHGGERKGKRWDVEDPGLEMNDDDDDYDDDDHENKD